MHDLLAFVAKESGHDRALALAAELHSVLNLLARMPGMGHARPDLTPRPLRFWPMHHWLVVYRAESRPLVVARVLGSGQDAARELDGPEEDLDD